MPKKDALSGWTVRGTFTECDDSLPGPDMITVKTVTKWNLRKLTDAELRRYIDGRAVECPNCHSKSLTPPKPHNGTDHTCEPPVPWITGSYGRECRDCGAMWEDCYEVPERGAGLVTTYPTQALMVPTYEEEGDGKEAAH